MEGLLESAFKMSQKVHEVDGVFLIYFAVLSLIFKVKQSLKAHPYSEKKF